MKPGCLVIHGFAGDVYEVLPLAQQLKDAGYAVECPTLEGHGLTRRQLARSKRHDWLGSAEEAYKRLAMRADPIVLIGFSMGGLLAIHLASKYPSEMLITVNTPYQYWDLGQVVRNLRSDFRPHASRYLNSMTRIPVSSMLQFRLLLTETKQIMPKVTCPSVILQTKRDDTVKAISAEHLKRELGSEDCSVYYFPESGHKLLLDVEAEQAIRLIQEQIDQRLTDRAHV
ncbi:alpha/beta fold hydrolase [Brevibacillus humidisoli]|uniref:alpha/beta hydrolase n=1 Tax=Brevibacillus humidisoli TaxID=2895522 RepID=UPI001E48D050|nr:alpha/beta fold hydrolase [Brevibacillus humidisoli]UFJ39791.1 alpha/beta fold hydrolase [Brevibacillus humidisoli]